ncbi:uncharacterized protein DFL_000686 [Arthrobotrys flagrans]|uniref:Uncharacterized protein n=1 Tax=Arthrobotrys flagrans TaxID=97331 RepID=A0A437AEF5_ARTFL|nr:hypothetical protein DFL_000686 [Arthrobotrys flagrans]
MSIQRTPTYDKSHYSWQPPSSQASESLISGEHGPGGEAKTPDATSYFHLPHQPTDAAEEDQLDTKPGLPKRSTFNYKHSSEEYKKQLEGEPEQGQGGEEFVAGRRGSITGKPFKPGSKRTKSWDYRDKRGEMQMSQLQEGDQHSQGFSET